MNGAGGVFGKHSVWSTKRILGVTPKPPVCENAVVLFPFMSMKKNWHI